MAVCKTITEVKPIFSFKLSLNSFCTVNFKEGLLFFRRRSQHADDAVQDQKEGLPLLCAGTGQSNPELRFFFGRRI